MASGAGWYGRNSNRSYPLTANATATDDSGRRLPEAVIGDLRMRFEGEPTDRAYVSHITVGEAVSVVISTTAGEIATVTVSREAAMTRGNVFPLVPLAEGVQGHIGFGDIETVENGRWDCSSASQSELLVGVATPRPASETFARFSRAGAPELEGNTVTLLGDGDIEVTQGIRELDGVDREAVIVRLAERISRDTLAEYAGPCSARPEAGNCGDPAPIESIGLVQPDCCGRIYIELRGCLNMYPITNGCGVVLTCNLGVEDACPDETGVPDENGRLPSEYYDECEPAADPLTQQALTETSRQSLQLTTTLPPTTTAGGTTTTGAPTTTITPTTTPSPITPGGFRRVKRTGF